MLRALRFAITKNFALDTEIRACLLTPTFFRPRLAGVSVERVREELARCFSFNTRKTLSFLRDYPDLVDYTFTFERLWLKPTTEKR